MHLWYPLNRLCSGLCMPQTYQAMAPIPAGKDCSHAMWRCRRAFAELRAPPLLGGGRTLSGTSSDGNPALFRFFFENGVFVKRHCGALCFLLIAAGAPCFARSPSPALAPAHGAPQRLNQTKHEAPAKVLHGGCSLVSLVPGVEASHAVWGVCRCTSKPGRGHAGLLVTTGHTGG